MKEHFSFYSIGSFLYAVFYTFCLYKNASGITYPFFVAGTFFYFYFSMQKLGVPYKKSSIFYLISIQLLGISNCLTDSPQLLFLNKCGIFLLAFILMLHTMYTDKGWGFPKYLTAFFQMIGTTITCLLCPFGDMVSYFDAQKQQKSGKKSCFIPVFIGIAITIPLLLIVILLLSSADAVFAGIFDRILESINFKTIFDILLTTISVFFCSYATFAALAMKNIKEAQTDHRHQEPITAIIITAALCFVYLIFSVIQILYLFIGNMQLPEGYTYSRYAREGFFQLLTVCILNLIIVLIFLYLFRENIVLKILLTVLSGCTFIMILSSALRMLMYINRYNLTLLRILVLWALAVIFLLMIGITVFIYRNSFPLFSYSMVVVTVFYIVLSFAHPDYWIARYNLSQEHLVYLNDYDIHDNQRYLSTLSADAAPILLNDKYNLYIREINDCIKEEGFPESYEEIKNRLNPEDGAVEQLDWMRRYYLKVEKQSKNMHIRNFNFSIHAAEKYLW
ncbi:MAG: DUF4173 domain-containing protein [Lachnospiraceae bacterium]|nr:DUF4173 domain-containing protein [Lachnospiraceae bacterium]